MQKHQQWLDNRTYEQHIHCLTKIKQSFRKKTVKSALNHRKRRNSLQQLNYEKSQQSGDTYPMTIMNSKFQKSSKVSSKQKQLIWGNFLLGKRIMQTNPVINNRKQQDEYKKHKKYIQWRIQRSKKLAVNTDFRQSKLKQYTLNTYRISNCLRLQTTLRSRFIMCLRIQSICLHKTSHVLEDVSFKMRTQGKKMVQDSEMVNVALLPNHEFMFKYYSDKENKNSVALYDVFIDVYEVKGLEQRYAGQFIIFKEFISGQKAAHIAQLKKFGKTIGQASFEVSVCRRSILKQQV